MNRDFLPYLLPVISILGLFVVVFMNPNITGFAVTDVKDKIVGRVVIYTDENYVIPVDSLITIKVDNSLASMNIRDFIKKNSSWYEIKTGYNPNIDYYGEGFTGNHIYSLDINEFGIGLIENLPEHSLNVKVVYNNKLISESNTNITKQ